MIIKRDVVYPRTGENRTLHIYLPRGYEWSQERYPVMYFFDGHNLFLDADATYGKSWGMKEFMDSWAKPMIIVGIECSHVGNDRLSEYLPYPPEAGRFGELTDWGDDTLRWVIKKIKPLIDREYRTLPFRECTAIGGSSMGGLMALRAAVGFNQWFSKVACVSSAIGFCPTGVMEDVKNTVIDPDTRVYLSWGQRESRIQDGVNISRMWNEAVAAQLGSQGAAVWAYCQEDGGHCEADWEKLVPGFMDFLWMR